MHDEIPTCYNMSEDFLERNMREGRGNKIAIHCNGESLTYAELCTRVNQAGNAMRACGIEIENRVLLILYDTPALVASYYGALKIGAVPVCVNTVLTTEEYRFFLEDSRAKLLIVEKELLSVVETAIREQPYLKQVVVTAEAAGYTCFQEWLGVDSPKPFCAKTHKDDVAFWQYSSGSTGKPKGTIHLQHDMSFCYEGFAKGVLGMTQDDVVFSASKLFFGYGMGNGMCFPFRAGATTILMPQKPYPKNVLDVIEKYRPTVFFSVPTLYASILREAEQKEYDLSSIRMCVSAGEALPPLIYYKWQERFGLEILDGIGSTESLHIFISNRPGKSRPGSAGQVVHGYEVKIVDEEFRELSAGEIGNLLVKGDSLAPCYWNNHEATKQRMRGEWFVTGDQFYRDDDGYYWYCGRSDDMIKVGGMWISPIEIVNCLLEHPDVREVGVLTKKDENDLLKLAAYVVLEKLELATDVLARELQTFVKKRLGPLKYPKYIYFRTELPKTDSGKLQRQMLS